MRFHLSERQLLSVLPLWLAAAVWAPALPQPDDYHRFADARGWLALPNALDVLSNSAFALAGAALLWLLLRPAAQALPRVLWGSALLAGGGLVFTAAGSALYHWQPDALGLVIDRMAMVVTFAAVLGLALADRVSDRAAVGVMATVLLLGPLAAYLPWQGGNATPWLVLQAGGLLVLLGVAGGPVRQGSPGVPWAGVVLVYAVAKGLEWGDHAVFELTQGLVSGHTLKHLVSALALWPVCHALAHWANCQKAGSECHQNTVL